VGLNSSYIKSLVFCISCLAG